MSTKYLSRTELAEEFGVVPHTIRNWEKRGILPRIEITSRMIRYRREDVDRLIQDQLVNPREKWIS